MQNILIAALAAFFLTTFVKTAYPKPVASWMKMLIAYSIALFFVISLHEGELRQDPMVVMGWSYAAAGLAGLLHKLHRLLSVLGDEKIRNIMAGSLARVARGR